MTERSDLATNEEKGQRCQVCEFPAIAGQVQGEIDGEQYSLQVCPSCFKYVILCLRDSYRQDRLFDDDFEIEELCGFGKAHATGSAEAEAWEKMKSVGREYGADDEQQAHDILERVNKGEEKTYSAEDVRKDLGLDKSRE